MSYVRHHYKKIVGYIGEHVLGMTYINSDSREIYVAPGLGRDDEKEIELHEVMHKIFNEADEYKNRLRTKLMLVVLGATSHYH